MEQEIRGVPLSVLAVGGSKRLQWTSEDHRSFSIYCRRKKLGKTVQKHHITDLVIELGFNKYGAAVEKSLVTKTLNAVRYHLNQRLKNVISDDDGSIVWPSWTQVWLDPNWDGNTDCPEDDNASICSQGSSAFEPPHPNTISSGDGILDAMDIEPLQMSSRFADEAYEANDFENSSWFESGLDDVDPPDYLVSSRNQVQLKSSLLEDRHNTSNLTSIVTRLPCEGPADLGASQKVDNRLQQVQVKDRAPSVMAPSLAPRTVSDVKCCTSRDNVVVCHDDSDSQEATIGDIIRSRLRLDRENKSKVQNGNNEFGEVARSLISAASQSASRKLSVNEIKQPSMSKQFFRDDTSGPDRQYTRASQTRKETPRHSLPFESLLSPFQTESQSTPTKRRETSRTTTNPVKPMSSGMNDNFLPPTSPIGPLSPLRHQDAHTISAAPAKSLAQQMFSNLLTTISMLELLPSTLLDREALNLAQTRLRNLIGLQKTIAANNALHSALASNQNPGLTLPGFENEFQPVVSCNELPHSATIEDLLL